MDDLVSTTLNNGVRIPLLGFRPEMKVVKTHFFIVAINNNITSSGKCSVEQTIGLSKDNTDT